MDLRAEVEYLRALEDLRSSFLLTEAPLGRSEANKGQDKHQFTCIHYAIRDAYAGCLQVLRQCSTRRSKCLQAPSHQLLRVRVQALECHGRVDCRACDDVMQSKRFQHPGSGSLSIDSCYFPMLYAIFKVFRLS